MVVFGTRRPQRQVGLRPAERPRRDDGLLGDRREGVPDDHERARRTRGRLTQSTEVPFAVILDNKIEATPTISYQRTPDGIDGNAQITGLSSGEANRIALVLQSGSLPVTFNTLSQSQVSATLGKDSLRQAPDRRHPRPARRDDLPAGLLPAARARRRPRAADLRGVLLRADRARYRSR